MIYDNSTWNSHPIYSKAIWIRVENQKRFWFIKRFLSRHLIESYRFIWILDEDVQFDFHPLTYECVVNHYQILSEMCFKNISSKKICAILDSFSMNHLSQGINTVDVGNRELPAYQGFYQKYKTKKQSFGAIDQHSSILYSCTNQSMT
ncbi:unnamed protein product [Adineta ricciae]|uniref:Uncharacterized protein n=1 Tax=Adineta ricciae TaxID=249248 RepID=A0A815TCN0_ADIRI|nr:unnamed protein product [Adineta ricciae]